MCAKILSTPFLHIVKCKVLCFFEVILNLLVGLNGELFINTFLGKRFASGGADKCVIIWTNKLEGILKYT